MDSSWILDVSDFLITTKSTINIQKTWRPLLYREKDANLMDTLSTKNISTNHLRIFNNWRIYFQVIRLSDLTNSKGDKVQPKYMQCRSSSIITSQVSRQQWPRQNCQDNKSFNIWRKLLQTNFSVDIKLGGFSVIVWESWTIPHQDTDH